MQSCTASGKPGAKWGNSGKCYTDVNKSAKVEQQRKSIEANKHKGK